MNAFFDVMTEPSNIYFHDNYIKSAGNNYGLYVSSFDDLIISNNTIETELKNLLLFILMEMIRPSRII